MLGATTGIPREASAEFTAGGFSNITQIPDYKYQAVSYYAQTAYQKYMSRINQNGRGIPDASALSEKILVSSGGVNVSVISTDIVTSATLQAPVLLFFILFKLK